MHLACNVTLWHCDALAAEVKICTWMQIHLHQRQHKHKHQLSTNGRRDARATDGWMLSQSHQRPSFVFLLNYRPFHRHREIDCLAPALKLTTAVRCELAVIYLNKMPNTHLYAYINIIYIETLASIWLTKRAVK